jgi:hypothetical protein
VCFECLKAEGKPAEAGSTITLLVPSSHRLKPVADTGRLKPA